MDQLAKTLTDPIMIGSMLAALACFATVITLLAPAMSGDKLESRLKAVASRREELRRKNRQALEKQGLKREARGFMKDTVDKFNLAKLLEDEKLETSLMQAGLRGPQPIATFYFFRFAMPIALGLAALFYVLGPAGAAMILQHKMGVVVGGVAAGYYLPNIYLTNLAQKRRDSIMKAFPDSLDMLLICVEAGMSIEMAIQRIAGEIGTASVELAEELSVTHAELSFLPDRRLAYENLAKRTSHPGVKSVAMALIQSEKYGTPLSQALRVMAKENRDMRISDAEKKAAALPAQLTVPMIVFFLPVLFLVILGPAFIKIKGMM